MNRAHQIARTLLEEEEESMLDFLDGLAGPEAIKRDLQQNGWTIEEDPEHGPYKAWRAFKELRWPNTDRHVLDVSIHPAYTASSTDPESYVIEFRIQGAYQFHVPRVSPFHIARYAAQIPRLFERARYDESDPVMTNIDRTLHPLSADMKAHTGRDMWENEEDDLKDFVLSAPWDSDPDKTLKQLGFKQHRHGGPWIKVIPLKHRVPWHSEKYFLPDTPDDFKRGMKQVGIAVGESTDLYRSRTDPDRPYVISDPVYWPLDVKRDITVGSFYGWNDQDVSGHHYRTVSGNKKLGDLSTRLETVTRALERAIDQADNGTAYKSDYDFFHAVSRYWGRQPNRIVRPYKRKKKKATARRDAAPHELPEPPHGDAP